jgi:predicted ATPase
LLHLAQETQNPLYLLAAQRNIGMLAYHQGKLREAFTYFERGIALHQANQRRKGSYDHEQNQFIATLRYFMGTLWLLGYPEQAQIRMKEMLERTRYVARPFSMLISLDFAIDLEHNLRRPQNMRALVTEFSALSAKYPYPHCSAYELAFRGWLLSEQGEYEEGIPLIKQGIEKLCQMGVLLFWPEVLKLLLDAYRFAKEFAQGLVVVTETLAFVAETGEHYWSAEFHRLKGELLLAQGASVKECEQSFQQALIIARQQEAKSLQLRAATNLAQLWQTQGREAEAHTLLAEIYGWFTEGFDTPDLQAAQLLLAELKQVSTTH